MANPQHMLSYPTLVLENQLRSLKTHLLVRDTLGNSLLPQQLRCHFKGGTHKTNQPTHLSLVTRGLTRASQVTKYRPATQATLLSQVSKVIQLRQSQPSNTVLQLW